LMYLFGFGPIFNVLANTASWHVINKEQYILKSLFYIFNITISDSW
jgi:hypothetical protein